MSQSRTQLHQCPHCGKEFEIEVFDTIHAEQDEDLREKCISGDIFRISCPHCKSEYMIQYPLLYIDQPHQFVILLSDQEPLQDLKNMGVLLSKKGYTLRRTPTLKEFTEKITILEDGVDDRLVELAKYDSFIEVIDNQKAKAEEITSVEYQKTTDEVMKINVRMDDKGMSFMIPLAGMEEEMDQNRQIYQIQNESFPVVNTEWIIDLFTEPLGQA